MDPAEIRGRDTNRSSVERMSTLSAEFDPELSALPDFAALRDYWAAKRQGVALPRYADIDPIELKDHLGDLFVARLTEDGSDFRYSLLGTKLTLVHGSDHTGRTVAETFGDHAPDFAAEVTEAYKTCVRTGRPLLAHGQVVWANKDFLDFRALHVPCSSDGARRDIVLGKLVFARPGGGSR